VGFSEDELKKIEAHAYKLGVKTHTTVDAVKGILRSHHQIPDFRKLFKE
jgi:argininosuccinate synthase